MANMCDFVCMYVCIYSWMIFSGCWASNRTDWLTHWLTEMQMYVYIQIHVDCTMYTTSIFTTIHVSRITCLLQFLLCVYNSYNGKYRWNLLSLARIRTHNIAQRKHTYKMWNKEIVCTKKLNFSSCLSESRWHCHNVAMGMLMLKWSMKFYCNRVI